MADKKSFELDSGLPNDYETVVENAEFSYREVYRGGDVPLLILYCASPEEEIREELFSIGGGWEIADSGGRVEGRPRFLASSWIGRLIVRCSELSMPNYEGGDNGSVLDFIADRGTAQQAHIWVGLKFKMTREEIDFGKGIGLKQHIMPTKCLGLMTSAEVTAYAGSKDDAADFADDSAGMSFEEPAAGNVEPLVQTAPEAEAEPEPIVLALLKPLAKSADTAVAFQTAVVSSYAGSLSAEWLARLMDTEKAAELYKELRG